MSVNAYGANFPPLPDGMPYDLLIALWNRTGGATGIVPKVQVGIVASSGAAIPVLTADWNQIDVCPAGGGVVMPQRPPLVPGQDITIFNQSLNPALIYPPSGMNIDALAPDAGYSLPVGKMQCFRVLTLTQIRSTQFG